MAVVKNILKLTQVQGVIKCSGVNSDVATIDLSVDLKKSTETVTTPEVNIQRIHWMTDRNAEFEIHRNSVLIAHGFGSGFTDYRGFSENTENTSDIVITFSNGEGIVILELTKVAGYGPQQHQDAPLDTVGGIYNGGSLG